MRALDSLFTLLSVSLLGAAAIACAPSSASQECAASPELLDPVAPPSEQERAGIEAAIQHYLHGIAEPDRARLEQAFNSEHATMVRAVRNEAGIIEVSNFKDMVAVLDEWGAREEPPRGALDSEILSIEVIDGRLALVSLRYWNTVYDALILARVGERWEIVAKAYTDQ